MLLEDLHNCVRDGSRGSAMFRAHFLQERVHQVRQVILMLAKRRHVDIENVEPVEQVVAQFSARDGFFWNLVGCGQNADVDGCFYLATQAT